MIKISKDSELWNNMLNNNFVIWSISEKLIFDGSVEDIENSVEYEIKLISLKRTSYRNFKLQLSFEYLPNILSATSSYSIN